MVPLLLVLLLAVPASAAPSALDRATLMLRSTTATARSLEAPLGALIDSSKAVATSGGARDPVLLLERDAAIVDRQADALARKAVRLEEIAAELARDLGAPPPEPDP